jgi:hypothetical protein
MAREDGSTKVLMEEKDRWPGDDLKLYRRSLQHLWRSVLICVEGVIDTLRSISLIHNPVDEYDLPSWLMVVLVLCDRID